MGPTGLNDGIPTCKLLVIGSSGVGKTALTRQFFMKIFSPGYDPCIEDVPCIKNTEIDGKTHVVEVQEFEPNEKYPKMRECFIRNVDGFLLVYSSTDKSSFENIVKICTEIIHVKGDDSCQMLLVANKADLVDLREVSELQGREQSHKFNIPFIETSARNPQDVDAAFHKIILTINKSRAKDLHRSEKQGYLKKCGIA